ncbi:MAG: ribonuclease E/G [Parvularculaceae bacterium]
MTRRLYIDCGAAETRAVFIENDVVTHFWFGAARGDEHPPQAPEAGDVFAGRVRTVSKSLRAAFVDIGAAQEAFLPFKAKEKPPVEGERLVIAIRRPPIGAKGAVVTMDWRRGLQAPLIREIDLQATKKEIGSLEGTNDAALRIVRRSLRVLSGNVDIIVNDPSARIALANAGVAASLTEASDLEADAEAALAEALEPRVSQPNGAVLFFHETQAGVLIDVDSGAAGEGASAQLNDKTNLAAAGRIILELSRRSLGGRVIVDFLPPTGATARNALVDSLKAGLKEIAGARFGRIAPDGLCDFTLPRTRLSLLEQATAPAGDGWPVSGRCFTIDWSAKSAVRTLERALRRRPSLRPRLFAPAGVLRYLERDRPQWRARLAEKYGARFDIIENDKLNAGRHDLAE